MEGVRTNKKKVIEQNTNQLVVILALFEDIVGEVLLNLHIVSQNSSMVVLVQVIQELHSFSLMFQKPAIYRCGNLKIAIKITTEMKNPKKN